MLSKESKIKVLEAFHGIDYALFGKPLKKFETCCPVIKEEYVTIKGALLSVYIEMLKLMGHSPAVIEEKIDSIQLVKMAKESARNARHAAKKVVTTEQARENIKTALKEALQKDKDTDASKLVETKIREKAFKLAIDNLLIASALQEATNLDAMNDWTGKIVEDSYKILRDNLCETAMLLISDESEE